MCINSRVHEPFWLLAEARDQEQDFVIVLITPDLQHEPLKNLKQCLQDEGVCINATSLLSSSVAELFIKVTTRQAWELFQRFLLIAMRESFDIGVLPVSTRKKKLLICDMDSTIVASETLDDIAKQVGLGEQVSKLTQRAMQGELDFRQALDERIGLLKGLPNSMLKEVVESVQFNAGAEMLLSKAKQHSIRTVLVSGGFEPIVKRVAEKLGFDRYVCNKLEVSNGHLTGTVLEPVVDSEKKLNVLMEECRQLKIDTEQVCAIGDGANDIPMLKAAGLGIGFEGKPLVRDSIPYQVNTSGLESVLSMMGIVQ